MDVLTIALFCMLHCLAAIAQNVVMVDIWKPTNTSLTDFTNGTLSNSPNGTSGNDVAKRQDPFMALLAQKPDKSLYWINITIGTPGQHQALQLDTSSSGLLVPEQGSNLCSSSLIDCADLGSFDSSQSSTFDDTDQSDTESFIDGSSVTGDWFYDTVGIGGQTVTSQLAVLGTDGSSISEGVLGVGWPASYPTINHNLAAQGVIASNSYSLWLDDLAAQSGTILFGGLNLAKFSGVLLKVPVVGTTNSDGSVSYNQAMVELTRVVTLHGLARTTQTGGGFSQNAVLDTGTTLTVLQQTLGTRVVEAMGAQFYPSGSTSGTTIIPCSRANADLSVNFHFADPLLGPTINVDISQLVLQDLGQLDGVEMCQFGIYVSDGSYPTILGDTFLRSAYVVYDLDTNHIGLAQTILNSGASNIVEIPEIGIPVGIPIGNGIGI